jgi:hypothetical protein
MAETGRGSLGR